MSKRFRDNGIWKKEWFRKLTPELKCAWTYLCDECDSVGVIRIDKEAAEFMIRAKIDWDALLSAVNGNIVVLPDGKWFLVDFCDFQYGELTEKCPPHRTYLSLLKKHGLLSRVRLGYSYPNDTAQEEEEEKEKEKEEEEVRVTAKPTFDFKARLWENITDEMVKLWEIAYPACDINTELAKMASWLIANPKKKKSQYGRFITGWLSRCQDKGGTK